MAFFTKPTCSGIPLMVFGFWILLSVQCKATEATARNITTNSTTSSHLTEKVRALLEKDGAKLVLNPNYVDLTLLVGWTGAGKSTMAQIMSGNLSHLESYKHLGTTLINDTANEISGSQDTFKSRTSVPGFIIDTETDTGLYDFPGFSDNRGIDVEITNGIFMNTVIKHSQRIRILVIENYSTVQPGESRDRIFNLIRQILQFARNLAAYEGGIAFVATKMRDAAEDSDVIEGIAGSLKAAWKHANETAEIPKGREQDAHALFNSWLKQDSQGKYVNLAFFRQPTVRETGILSTLPKVVQNRESIRKVVFNNTFFQYMPTNAAEFGTPISDKSLLEVEHIQQDLLSVVKDDLRQVKKDLLEQVRSLTGELLTVESIRKIVSLFDLYSTNEEDLRAAIEVVKELGMQLDDRRVILMADSLEMNRKYMADLEDLPTNSSSNRVSTVPTSEATKEARQVLMEVKREVATRVKATMDARAPLETLKSRMQGELRSGQGEEQMWRQLMMIAGATEECGSELDSNVRAMRNLMGLLNLSEGTVGREMKMLEEYGTKLKYVESWDKEGAARMKQGLMDKFKDVFRAVVEYAGNKAGIMETFGDFGRRC